MIQWAAVASLSGSAKSGVATPNQHTAGEFRPDGLSQTVEPPLAEQLSIHENAINMMVRLEVLLLRRGRVGVVKRVFIVVDSDLTAIRPIVQ